MRYAFPPYALTHNFVPAPHRSDLVVIHINALKKSPPIWCAVKMTDMEFIGDVIRGFGFTGFPQLDVLDHENATDCSSQNLLRFSGRIIRDAGFDNSHAIANAIFWQLGQLR